MNESLYPGKLMRAALFYGAGDVRLTQVAIPEIAVDEVLVRVRAALTCGSDLKAFRQGHPVLLGSSYPAPFGHELAGEIVAVGRAVANFEPGMRVVAANSAPCDTCYFCRINQPNLCDNLNLLNGAYAEYIKIPGQIVKHNLYQIPDHLPFSTAALTEPLACAVHAYYRLNIAPEDCVVVLGCGIMGLLFSAVASHHGAKVIALGRNDKKLALAKKLGVQHTVDVREHANPVTFARNLTPSNLGSDFVLEAIGDPGAWQQACAIARKGGTVCLFGGCKKGSTFSLDTHRVHYEELTVRGIFHHTPEYFAKALSFFSDGIIDGQLFIEDTVSLDQVEAVYQKALHGSFFKTAVVP